MFDAEVLYDFAAGEEGELNLTAGQIVHVTNNTEAEWWEGELNGKRGLFPANYVERVAAAADQTSAEAKLVIQEKKQDAASSPTSSNTNGTKAKSWGAGGGESTANLVNSSTSSSSKDVSSGDKNKSERGGGGGGGGGGGEKKGGEREQKGPTMSATRVGLWAHNMAFGASLALFACGLCVMIWVAIDPFTYTYLPVFIGFYCVLLSGCVYIFESRRGMYRTNSRVPVRGLLYSVLCVPCFFTIPTLFSGILLALCAIFNIVSALMGEFFLASEQEMQAAASKDKEKLTLAERYKRAKEEDKLGAFVFLTLYFSANVLVWGLFFEANRIAVNSLPPEQSLSAYVPWAKAFGSCLDFNVVLLLIPVCRTLVRWLYDYSTRDQTCGPRTLRAILYFVPIDQALKFHQLVAWVTLFHVVGHVCSHFLNYVSAADHTWTRFGIAPWISGGIILGCMLLLYAATPHNVKSGQFEIFWYAHHLFVPFFAFNLVHGAGWFGPNFWKWFVVPGGIYALERCYREFKSSQDVLLVSVTHMLPSVMCLELGKVGALASYKEGQYIYLNCPYVSRTEWHPFTISSAPQEETVTVHIRIMGTGSWTRGVQDFLKMMGKQNEVHVEFNEMRGGTLSKGKLLGPDGRKIFRIYGPHSAPTQHLGEYNTAMIVASGIGVTPLCASLKSIVHHRWKYFIGKTFPDKAFMYWVVGWDELDSFKWFIRTIKEAEDEVAHIDSKAGSMQNKTYEFHIFVTSIPNSMNPKQGYAVNVSESEDTSFWGRKRKDITIEGTDSNVTEAQLYSALKNPPEDHMKFGQHIFVHKGRPNWSEQFQHVNTLHQENDVGVLFCGNPRIGVDLAENCKKYSSVPLRKIFRLHREVF